MRTPHPRLLSTDLVHRASIKDERHQRHHKVADKAQQEEHLNHGKGGRQGLS
jgi:hypothetical protein